MAEKRFLLRPWVRAIHRDMGYLAVGFTVLYALSGIAVNHISDWDPNFHNYERTVELGGPLTGADDDALGETVRAKLGITTKPRAVDRTADDQIDVVFDKRTLHVNTTTGRVVDEGQKPRLLLRVANWLHLNRGKKSWTYMADAYAAGLLFLAISGLFMIPGKKGLLPRGAIFLLIGISVPLGYVQLSGGPEALQKRPAPSARPLFP